MSCSFQAPPKGPKTIDLGFLAWTQNSEVYQSMTVLTLTFWSVKKCRTQAKERIFNVAIVHFSTPHISVGV